jgi:hypothetical protein
VELSGQIQAPAALPQEKEPSVYTGYEAGRLFILGLVWNMNTLLEVQLVVHIITTMLKWLIY